MQDIRFTKCMPRYGAINNRKQLTPPHISNIMTVFGFHAEKYWFMLPISDTFTVIHSCRQFLIKIKSQYIQTCTEESTELSHLRAVRFWPERKSQGRRNPNIRDSVKLVVACNLCDLCVRVIASAKHAFIARCNTVHVPGCSEWACVISECSITSLLCNPQA